MNMAVRQSCIDLMRRELPPETIETLRNHITADPDRWWRTHHFNFGMKFRNFMRDFGFGERQMEVDTLDDCYIQILEEIAELGPASDGVDWSKGF